MPSDEMQDPSFPNLLNRAQALMQRKRWQEALPLLTRALSIAPEDTTALCLLSWVCLELGDSSKAADYANQAISADPTNEWGHRLRSNILRRQGKNKAAVEAAEEAVRHAPD